MTTAGTLLGVLEETTASGGDAFASGRDAAKHARAVRSRAASRADDHPAPRVSMIFDGTSPSRPAAPPRRPGSDVPPPAPPAYRPSQVQPTSSAGSDRSEKSRVASPAVSIDHLHLPPLDDLPCDIGSGDFDHVLAHLDAVADDDDLLVPPVAPDEGDYIFDASRDHLRFPGGSVTNVSSADSARASDAECSGGDGDGARASSYADAADAGDDKKRARLVRNRESAQQSRARKKQYVEELERKCRDLGRANAELRAFASTLMAECAGLRHHLHLATGKPPPPPGTVLPHPPPPGAAHATAPKIALPPTRGVMPDAGVPAMPAAGVPATPGAGVPDAGVPERLTPAKRRKRAPGGAVAAAVAATLAVLSVACVATAGSGSRAALVEPGKLALAASTTATPVGGSARRLLDANLDANLADATGMSAMLEATRRASVSSGAIPLRGRGRSVAIRDVGGEVRASALGPRRGSVLDDDIHADVGAEDEDGDGDATGSGSTPRGGEDDPWYAAFRAAGMRGANAILSRASCDEIFRFQPANDGVGVAGEAFARRLREATTRERDETRDGDEDVVFVAGGDRDDVARPGATPPPPRMTPELPPSAIPLPPSRPSVAAGRSDARGGPPPPPVAGRRLPDPGALIGGGVGAGDARDGDLGEDASLVSVLLPPAPTSSADGLGVGSLSKIFVVAYSRRSADYVTYSCRLPKGRSVA